MQDKSEHYSEFSERTDKLAVSLGGPVSALIPLMKVSNGMLFAYRTGKHRISNKAWRKLESLERVVAEPPGLKKGVKNVLLGEQDQADSRLYALTDDTPSRSMPTRSDCEAYLRSILDLAQDNGSPENIPAIMHRLKKQFPLTEWERDE